MNKGIEKQSDGLTAKPPYSLKRLVHLVYAALILVFILQNLNLVETRLFFFSFWLPHAFLLTLALGTGAALGVFFAKRSSRKGEKALEKPPVHTTG